MRRALYWFIIAYLPLSTDAAIRNIQWLTPETITDTIAELYPRSYIFQFSNQGPDTLRPRVQSPREGVILRVEPERIYPHGKGKVSVAIFFRGQPAEKEIPIFIASGEEHDTLLVSARFKPPFTLSPALLAVNALYHGDTLSALTDISWRGVMRPRLSINRFPPHIASAAIDTLKHTYAVTFQLIPSAAYGPFSDTVAVETGTPQWPTIFIPITGETKPFLTAEPAYMDFGTISGNARHFQKVDLKSKRIKYDIVRVETDPPFLMVSISRNPDRDWQVVGTIYPHSRHGVFQGSIKLYVSQHPEPELVIPCKGEIL